MVDTATSGMILVVGGDSRSREAVAHLLMKAGYEVAVAATNAEALVLAEVNEFDLVIIEYGMPFAGPVDLFRRLRWRCPRIRGIFLTEGSSAYGTAAALSAGVERVVQRSVAVGNSGTWLTALVEEGG